MSLRSGLIRSLGSAALLGFFPASIPPLAAQSAPLPLFRLQNRSCLPARLSVPQSHSIKNFLPVDLDGDGDPDLLSWAFPGNPVFWNDGNGSFREGGGIPVEGLKKEYILAAVSGDVDRDGDPDLVAASGWALTILKNEGPRGFPSSSVSHIKGSPLVTGPLLLFDADGDGDLDAAAGGNSFFFINDGKGNFKKIESSGINPPPVPAWGLTIGDIDKDGRDDIIVGYGTEERKTDIWGRKVPTQGKVNGGAWIKVWCPRPADWYLKSRAGEIAEDIETLLESK